MRLETPACYADGGTLARAPDTVDILDIMLPKGRQRTTMVFETMYIV